MGKITLRFRIALLKNLPPEAIQFPNNSFILINRESEKRIQIHVFFPILSLIQQSDLQDIELIKVLERENIPAPQPQTDRFGTFIAWFVTFNEMTSKGSYPLKSCTWIQSLFG